MKKLLFLLLIPTTSLGQSREPFKKATKIMVTPKDTTKLLNRISLMLYEKGYAVESKDEQLKFVSSTEKGLGSISIKIRALIRDSVVIFSGVMASNEGMGLYGVKRERTFNEIYYSEVKKSSQRKAWDEFESFAKLFGTNVKYLE